MADATVIFVEDPAGMEVLTGPIGPIAENLRLRARRLTRMQIAEAPKRSWHLAASITEGEMVRDRTGLSITVGVNPHMAGRVGYATFMAKGTLPHVIAGRNGGYLAFRHAGRMVYTRRVMHPGTRPNPYLTRWIGIVV